jgi:putative effector of murein hydrolase LrgA (UPF0299 family)
MENKSEWENLDESTATLVLALMLFFVCIVLSILTVNMFFVGKVVFIICIVLTSFSVVADAYLFIKSIRLANEERDKKSEGGH